jgi:hypothetical protein
MSVKEIINESDEYDIKELMNVWVNHVLSGQTFMVVGGTGIGKTQWVYEIAKRIQENTGVKTIVKVFHPARTSNTDYVIPIISNEEIKKAITKEFKELANDKDEKGNPIRIIAFFDEYDRADGLTRNALLSLINERVFEDVVLPPTTSIILAGNQEFSRDTYELNQAEKARMPIYYFNLKGLTRDNTYFKYWLGIAREKLNINEKIISFIVANPEYLFKEEMGSTTFPTPRTWELLSKAMSYLEEIKGDTKLFIYKSYLGPETAGKFKLFEDYILSMPPAEDILSGKFFPETLDKQYASLQILANYVKDAKTLTEVLRFIKSKYGDELLYIFVLSTYSKDKIKRLYSKIIDDNKNSDIIKAFAKITQGLNFNGV